MDYNMPLILALTYLLIIFLILVILVEFTYRANESKSDAKREVILRDNTKLESKIDLIVKNFISLEQLIRPVVDITQKHENILSGRQSKGALGEQFVEERLADLPHEWYDRKVSFSGGTVEFALRTPNKRWIPIDSQWTATDLLVKLGQVNSQSQRDTLRTAAHQAVNIRAREALKYLDKERTLGFCIVAVPDSVFSLCVDIQANLASYSIVLVSYSLLVPYILLIVNQYLKTVQSTDTLQVSQILSRSAAEIELIQKYITKEVVSPLEIVSRQQSQHFIQRQGLEDIYKNLNQIQSQLNTIKNMNNPVPNSTITSISPTLQRQLSHVRDGLLEGAAKQNNGQEKDIQK